MIFSVTERGVFKRCRRRWDYSSPNRQSLTPVSNAPALELGTLVHATLAEWTSDPSLDPTIIYNQHCDAAMLRIAQDYLNIVGVPPSEIELKPMMESFALGEFMIKNYADYHKRPLPTGYELVENEQTILIPVKGTEHCECELYAACECHTKLTCITNECECSEEGCKKCRVFHYLEATFDGIMQDVLGQLFIIERKTFGRHPSTQELDENDQFLAYAWSLSQLPHGRSVRGVSYDGLWKRDKPPAGRKMSDLFLRRTILHPEHAIEEFGMLLPLELNDMANPNVPIYKNVPVLQGCWDCNFRPLCVATTRGDHPERLANMYTVRNHKEWRKSHED